LLVEVKDLKHQNSRQYHISLPGIYQTKNIVTVLQSVRLLQDNFHISEEDIAAGIKEVKTLTGLYGRWEVIHMDPMIVLEVAHNKNGIEQMLRHISGINHRQLHLVFGMVKDKDIDAVLSLLPKNAFYYFTKAHLPRALPAEELQKTAGLYNLSGEVYSDVNAALMQATHLANKNDLIIVFGSIFLVAEVDKTHYHNIPNL
jgi:dihydrofolate synthase/folylpolyglutamate synthase